MIRYVYKKEGDLYVIYHVNASGKYRAVSGVLTEGEAIALVRNLNAHLMNTDTGEG